MRDFLLSKKHQTGSILVALAIVGVILGVSTLIAFSYLDDTLDTFEIEKATASKVLAQAFEKGINNVQFEWAEQHSKADFVAINGLDIEVTADGWAKQLNSNVQGCISVWDEVIPAQHPAIAIYNPEVDAEGWSVGGGPGICYFINQNGLPFEQDKTPYFSYSNVNGQVMLFNMWPRATGH